MDDSLDFTMFSDPADDESVLENSSHVSKPKMGTLEYIANADLLGLRTNVFGSAHFDNKAYQVQEKALGLAIEYICPNKFPIPYRYLEVFLAVYGAGLKRDAWNGTLYYNDKSTTFSKLTAQLEQVFQSVRPGTSDKFYERQLDLFMEYREFQPVKQYIEGCYKTHTTKRVTNELNADGYFNAPYTANVPFQPLPDWDNLGKILFGTDDELTQKMITTWLLAAAKRVLEPGCYQKRAIIIRGDQDAGKSAFVAKLAKYWGTELPSGTSDMDFMRMCTRTWIMELAEIDRLMKGRDASVLKQQLSTLVDKYVPKYKEADEMRTTPRLTVFIGTTNKSQFLVDDTGNNRYWVVDLPPGWKLPLSWLDENVDHLWATAYHKVLYEGCDTDLSDADIALSEIRNKSYLVEGSWNEQIEVLLDKVTYEGEHPVAFKMTDIMSALGIHPENQGKNKTAVLNSLKQLGYELKSIRVGSKTAKYYSLSTGKPDIAKWDNTSRDWIVGERQLARRG